MKRFILALQFLTIFRVKKDIQTDAQELSRAMAYFPLVGAVQGVLLVVSNYILSGLLPETVTNAVLVLILVISNGALHLDGFADTIDGLAGGSTPEERLKIMRDGSVGPTGVVFLIFILLLKYLSIQEIPDEAKKAVLFMFPVIGRWAMVPMAYWSKYARSGEGIGSAFAGNSAAVLVEATVIASILSAIVLGVLSLVFMVALLGVIYAFSIFFKKKIGGVTGDVFGFQSEVAEALFLMMVLALTSLSAR